MPIVAAPSPAVPALNPDVGGPRSRITAETGQLLRRRGYAATGLNDIVTAAAAPKGSLYHYFPGGKEQIASEAIARSGEVVTAAITTVLEAATTMPAAVRDFASLLAGNLEKSDFRDGCPVATTTLEMAAESGSLRSVCGASFSTWTATIASRLAAEGYADAPGLAVLILSAFEGALMMARALSDVTPLFAVAETLIETALRDDRCVSAKPTKKLSENSQISPEQRLGGDLTGFRIDTKDKERHER